VPTYCGEAGVIEISPTSQFELYDTSKQYPTGPRILIEAPKELDIFLASLLAFDRVSQAFPTCSVFVKCNPIWAGLLPSSVQYSNEPTNSGFYRTFNFNKGIKDQLNPIALALMPAHEIILGSTGISHYAHDRGIAQIECDKPMVEGEGLGFISDGGAFANDLKEMLSERIDFKVFYVGNSDLNAMNQCRKVISSVECGEALAMGYLRKPTIAFILSGGASRVIQYKQYDSIKALPTPPNKPAIEAMVDKIIAWVKE
jgi:hypothetical protein